MEVTMACFTPVTDAARTLRPIANFFTETLERKNRRVGGHTNGEHDARNARHGQAEQAEMRKQRQNAQVQTCEHGHGGSGDKAQA